MTNGDLTRNETLACIRTTLAIERTRLAADRTLMATLRTAFSLISFGFTLFSFFRTLVGEDLLYSGLPERAPARFGLLLVMIGLIVLVLGIRHELLVRRRIRETERQVAALGAPADGGWPRSGMLMASILLLVLGLIVVLAIAIREGPLA